MKRQGRTQTGKCPTAKCVGNKKRGLGWVAFHGLSSSTFCPFCGQILHSRCSRKVVEIWEEYGDSMGISKR